MRFRLGAGNLLWSDPCSASLPGLQEIRRSIQHRQEINKAPFVTEINIIFVGNFDLAKGRVKLDKIIHT